MYRDKRWLIDCGEGTQRQILRSGLGFKRLDTVLLTHGHLDHILGLGGLVSTFARWESIDRITIHGGRSALDRVRDLMGVVLRGDEVAVTVPTTSSSSRARSSAPATSTSWRSRSSIAAAATSASCSTSGPIVRSWSRRPRRWACRPGRSGATWSRASR
ncbi:MAG: MBL fold metallo-hydrolase [Anaerolineae bacterium]